MKHIGKTLRQILRQKNLSAESFAQLIGRSNQTVYDMFRREHIHPKLLEKISAALEHDMFQYLRENGDSPAEKKLMEKISRLEKENEQLKNENAYLKEIVRLKGK
ncbi:MAG: helix-turn-helix transcriptional regulator [Bacteroidetes bacterium]|nr:helix-turn-helix transcriptional regulator [Bacteroidota bacterium]